MGLGAWDRVHAIMPHPGSKTLLAYMAHDVCMVLPARGRTVHVVTSHCLVICLQLILGHKPLSRARVGCAGAIATAYRDAYGSVGRYEELRAINDFCASYDAVAYQMAERDVTQYRRDMVMIK